MNANVWIKPAKLCCRCWIITLMVSLLCKNKTVLNNCQNGCEVGDEFQREHFAYCSRLWWILRHSFQLIWISTKRTVLFIGWKQRSGSVSPPLPPNRNRNKQEILPLEATLELGARQRTQEGLSLWDVIFLVSRLRRRVSKHALPSRSLYERLRVNTAG